MRRLCIRPVAAACTPRANTMNSSPPNRAIKSEARRGLKDACGCDESLIAEVMPQFIVDPLHAIKINQSQRHAVPIALCELQLLFRNCYEAMPIVEPSKRVCERETL